MLGGGWHPDVSGLASRVVSQGLARPDLHNALASIASLACHQSLPRRGWKVLAGGEAAACRCETPGAGSPETKPRRGGRRTPREREDRGNISCRPLLNRLPRTPSHARGMCRSPPPVVPSGLRGGTQENRSPGASLRSPPAKPPPALRAFADTCRRVAPQSGRWLASKPPVSPGCHPSSIREPERTADPAEDGWATLFAEGGWATRFLSPD